jgi:hypothetical protein
MSSRQLRSLWSDAERTILTLESFARTEEDGGLDLLAAAHHVRDPELQKSLRLHAEDERRHAQLFRARAGELRLLHSVATLHEADRALDLARARGQLAHQIHAGFDASLCEELGELGYVAMLHVAERRAAALFERQRDALAADAATRAIFDAILRDEKFHIAYTGSCLKRWAQAGRGHEVRKALGEARGSRLFGAWKRLGLRCAGRLGRALLWLSYWTVLLPFCCIARAHGAAPGWRIPAVRPSSNALRSQS